MNQLNQFMQQMQSLFAGMTSQSKLMAILLTVGIGISSAYLIQGAATGNGAMAYLLDGMVFDDEELVRIQFALGNAGLRGWETVGHQVRIPKSSSDLYYKAITEGKAVPARMGSAVETVLNSNSFLESTMTTEAKRLAAKLKDLGNRIKGMDPMIQDAFVTYDNERLGFSSDKMKVASVAIKTRGGKELPGEMRLGIIAFLEKSFSGLKQSNIVVVCNGIPTQTSDDPAAMQQSKYYLLKSQQEEKIRRESERLLVDYGNVRVGVNAEIDPVASEKSENLTLNEKPVKIQSVSSKKDAKNQRMGTGGKPGTETNSFANKGQSINQTPDQNSETKEQSESEKLVTGSTVTQTEKIGLQIKLVSVSVSIPSSYYRKAAIYKWQEANPGKPIKEFPEMNPSELTAIQTETERSIQKKINAILPKVAAGEDKSPRVAVESYQDMPVPEPPAISYSERSMEWLSQSWQTLALIGLVGVALISLRSFAKTIPSANDSDFERGFDLPLDDASDIDLSSLTDEENDAFDTRSQSENESAPPRLRTTGGDIKNDLTAMVRENPDAAATMLRNWITEST